MTEDYEVIGTARPETDRRCEGHGEKAGRCGEMAQAGWGGRLCYECDSRRRADLMRARLYPELTAKASSTKATGKAPAAAQERPRAAIPAIQGQRQRPPMAKAAEGSSGKRRSRGGRSRNRKPAAVAAA